MQNRPFTWMMPMSALVTHHGASTVHANQILRDTLCLPNPYLKLKLKRRLRVSCKRESYEILLKNSFAKNFSSTHILNQGHKAKEFGYGK